MQAKASSSPSQQRSTKPKPSVKPTRKSIWIATQSTQKPCKKSGSSKQCPPVIEEIVSSPKESPIRDPEIIPSEQGSLKTSAVSSGTAPAEPTPKPTLSALKKSFVKRKLSPKHLLHRALLRDLLSSLVLKRPRKLLPQCPHPNLLSCFNGVQLGAKFESAVFRRTGSGGVLGKVASTRLVGVVTNT